MKTSKVGLNLIKSFEGLRHEAYRDPVGVLTIGYGHTSRAGDPQVVYGMVISSAEAERILMNDLVQYENAVLDAVKAPMNQNEFDAFVSLCYNIGPKNFSGSSAVKYFNAGDKVKAAASMKLWRKAGGKVLPGLVRRREAEAALFQKPVEAPQAGAEIPDVIEVAPGFWERLLVILKAYFSNIKEKPNAV